MTHKSKEKQNIKILKLKILMLLPLSFQSPGGYLIFQGLDNGILAFHIFKLTGAKFPVQCHI